MATALKKAEATRNLLAEKFKQASSRVAKIKALEETKALKTAGAAARTAENRRKNLTGAFMLDGASNPLQLVNAKGQSLEQWLGKARDDERALFGLAPLAVTE